MTNAYCNMSAPPRSRVHKEVRTIGSHIVFDFAVLSRPHASLPAFEHD